MTTITNAELITLPPQRPQALALVRDRHTDVGSTTLAEKIGNRCEHRWLARAFIDIARRQERLQQKDMQ